MDANFGISGENGATQLQGELPTRLRGRVMAVLFFVSMVAKFGISTQKDAIQLQGELLTRLRCRAMKVLSLTCFCIFSRNALK